MARILTIDDDASFLSMLNEMLTRLGHEVLSLPDGRDALKTVKESPVDLVITDIIMPESEGLEVIMLLRREAPRVRIIAISGGGRVNAQDYLKFAKSFGAARTLGKPFTEAELKTAIEESLEL